MRFPRALRGAIVDVMERIDFKPSHYLVGACLVGSFCVVSALAFAGWLAYGADIVLTFSQNTLALCF